MNVCLFLCILNITLLSGITWKAAMFNKKLDNRNVIELETITLECHLSETNQIVHWARNDEPVVQDDRITVTSDMYKHQLIIRDVTLEDAGKISCVYGEVRTECTLNVEELTLDFTERLHDLSVLETQDVILQCRLSKPYQKVQWLTNSYLVPPYNCISIIADKFTHRLIIRNVTPEVSGDYRCVCDNDRTQCALTVIEIAATFTKELHNQDVNELNTVYLTCQLSKPHKKVQWMKNDKPVVQDGRITIFVDAHRHQFIINNVTLEDAGNFSCVYDNARTECTLKVQELTARFTGTLENQTVNKAATVNLECRLSKPNKIVQWVKDGEEICPDDRITVTVAIYTHRLVIQDVKMEDAGTFRCLYGNVSTQCTLTVKDLPEHGDLFYKSEFFNWIKTCVSLCFVKEGIIEFSNEKAADFHNAIKGIVSTRQSNAATTQCQQCTHKQARKTKGKGKSTTTWRMECRKNICNMWLEEILPYHRHQTVCPNIEWKNSDPRLWPSNCWEIVKIFMPYGCDDQHRAEDSDATGLLTLILDCQFFSKFMSSPQLLQEIKGVRNECMHSKNLLMDDTSMKQSLDLMVTFLGELELQKYQSAIDAEKKIKQLRDGHLDVSFMEERIIKEKLAEVKHNITRLENTGKNLSGSIGSMFAKQDTYQKEYRKRLEEFKERFSKAANTLRTFIKEKNQTNRKQFITLINRLQELEKDNREVNDYYQAKVSTLGSEEKDVNLDEQELIEKPAKRQWVTRDLIPWFRKELQNQTVYEKATVILECQLSKPNQTVTWLKGVTQVCSNDHITMETDNCIHRLIIRDVTLEDSGKFWCFCDDVSSCCTLKVNELPLEFITKLENHTVIESGTVTLACRLSKPNTNVLWMKNKEPILPDDRITVTTDTFIHRLVITDVTLEDAGNFRCFCDTDSTQCTLTVNELTSVYIKELENQTEKERGTVTLTCMLSRPNKKVLWMKGDQQLFSDYRITVIVDMFTHQLTIRDLSLKDAGNFRCVSGNVSTECTLKVEEMPLKFVKPLEDKTGYIKSKTTTTLSCELSRSNQKVTWRKKGQVVSNNHNLKIISGIFSHQLVFSELTLNDSGEITCACGDFSTTAKLTVKDDDDQDARQLWLDGCRKSAEDVQKAVLKKRSSLQQLTLVSVDLSSLGDKLSDVTMLQQLVRMELEYITLSHEQCQILGRDLRQSPQLRELALQGSSCKIQGWNSGYFSLDLGGSLRLHDITLKNLSLTQIVFNPEVMLRCHIDLDNVAGQVSALQNLLGAKNLQQFRCEYMIDTAAISKLVNVLPQLHILKQLELYHIDFGSVTDISLSATMDQLDSIELHQCKFEVAGLEHLLHQHSLPQRRVKISLSKVTIIGEEDMIRKIRKSPDTEVETVEDTECRGGEWWVGYFVFYTRK